jgi:two-component system, NarL family, invasion response regulator UvrY
MCKGGSDMNDNTRVLIIDDHPIVRDGCQRIFNRRSNLKVAEASTAEAGIALNETFSPHVIVLDVGLPDASGFDIIPKLIAGNSQVRIVIFSMYGTRSFVTSALEKGAAGYITKNDEPSTILTAIDKVRAGEIYLGRAIAQNLAMTNLLPERDPLGDLNERERRIMALLGKGKSLTEISIDLRIGYKTIANAVSLIKQKLHLTTSASLIKFAVELTLKS